jgi:hypothetical protein
MSDVIKVDFRTRPEVENEMVEAIKAVFYSYAGQVTTASAFGALKIATHDLEREILD